MTLDPAACRGYAKLIRKDAERPGWEDVATPQAWCEIADLLDAAGEMAETRAPNLAQAIVDEQQRRQRLNEARQPCPSAETRAGPDAERCPKCGGELSLCYPSAEGETA